MRSQVVVLVSFLSILLINCSKKESQEIQPTISDITESVYASGVIKAKGRIHCLSYCKWDFEKNKSGSWSKNQQRTIIV